MTKIYWFSNNAYLNDDYVRQDYKNVRRIYKKVNLRIGSCQ